MNPRDREFLLDHYRDDIRKLAVLLDRDLGGLAALGSRAESQNHIVPLSSNERIVIRIGPIIACEGTLESPLEFSQGKEYPARKENSRRSSPARASRTAVAKGLEHLISGPCAITVDEQVST